MSAAAASAARRGRNAQIRWGMFSVPDNPVPSLPGVSWVVQEMDWDNVETADNTWSSAYWDTQRARRDRFLAAGKRLILSHGLHDSPAWLRSRTNGKFKNQNGVESTWDLAPNFVFNLADRNLYGQRYISRVFSELGTTAWSAVRIGGGHWGELTYPQLFNDGQSYDPCPEAGSGKLCNYYWCYDANAQAMKTTAGVSTTWKPGDASPSGEAAAFIEWYLQCLSDYMVWQVDAHRTAGYTGDIHVLFPSFGMRSGNQASAAAVNLNGSTSPEVNGEVQRGFDYQRWVNDIASQLDRRCIIWDTYADQGSKMDYLRQIADASTLRLRLGAENAQPSAANREAKMETSIVECRQNRTSPFGWIRYGTNPADGSYHPNFIARINP